MARCPGGRIDTIADGSPAARHGLRPGDHVEAINGRPLKDILLYQDALLEDEQIWSLRRKETAFEVDFEGPFAEDPGVTFADDLFDGVRRCTNRCCFCFVDQLPPGMRSTLYVKDEDYRLSFLHGSYLTLSSISDDDLDVIEELGLSPLYVSVHATDPAVRRRLLGRGRLPSIVDQIAELAGRGVACWTQIVVVPGINDGDVLSRSLADLAALHPACLGVGVVPVGLTAHREGLPSLRVPRRDEAADCLDRIETAQSGFLRNLGSRFAWGADEFYRLADRPLPSARRYEGYPLLEDGIGMLRHFRDRLVRSLGRRKRPDLAACPRSLVATSRAAAPLFTWARERLDRSGWPVPAPPGRVEPLLLRLGHRGGSSHGRRHRTGMRPSPDGGPDPLVRQRPAGRDDALPRRRDAGEPLPTAGRARSPRGGQPLGFPRRPAPRAPGSVGAIELVETCTHRLQALGGRAAHLGDGVVLEGLQAPIDPLVDPRPGLPRRLGTHLDLEVLEAFEKVGHDLLRRRILEAGQGGTSPPPGRIHEAPLPPAPGEGRREEAGKEGDGGARGEDEGSSRPGRRERDMPTRRRGFP